ncbi:ParB N-terminal domain-containing protein [Acinetobacter johnsonii]|uniref:ParB N-terminal domain-containing protein n=1 Tax=Acinetobacter johnsonii TaxID=40214 RepID=UPI002D800138|nr:ParB N-terminal domain-containing protein [Acinetobacter johnsonii]
MELEINTVKHLPISELLLDPLNPRLGESANETITQDQIVSLIINNFGIDDLLSSMSYNGYFEAEPLVCQKRNGQYYIIEGNRRLVTCLILGQDPRAKNHIKDFKHFIDLHEERGSPNVKNLPIVIFKEDEDPKKISAYLGIRHIVSTKDWDSFAKARWINETITNQKISIKDISIMTGDKSGTIKSLLSGYNFMNQLEHDRKFNRDATVRKGRGSNVSYPFSWVYTLFNYPNARNFLGLEFFTAEDKPNLKPIPENKLDDAVFVIDALFGNSNKGQDSLLKDSREIPKFAEALGNPEKVYFLKKGKSLLEVNNLTTNINERLETIFFECIESLEDARDRITKEPQNIVQHTISDSDEKILHINKLLKSIRQQLSEIQSSSKDDLEL